MEKLEIIEKRIEEISGYSMSKDSGGNSATDARQAQPNTMTVPYWSDTVCFVEVPRLQIVEKTIQLPRFTVIKQRPTVSTVAAEEQNTTVDDGFCVDQAAGMGKIAEVGQRECIDNVTCVLSGGIETRLDSVGGNKTGGTRRDGRGWSSHW